LEFKVWQVFMNQQKNTFMQIVPWLADGVALGLLWLLLPTAVSTLQAPSAINVIYLIGVFGLMCAGVFLVRRLEPGAGRTAEPHRVQPLWLALGVLFGAAVMTVMAFQFNYFASVFAVDTLALGEGQSATLFVFAPGAWLGTSLLYAAFLALPITPKVAEGNGRYPWQAFIGLLFINSMFIFMVAQLKAVFALVGGPSYFIAFPMALGLFLLLFGPPRLLYLNRQGGMAGLSLMLLTAVSALLIVV
jgi:hypothetical protein